MHSATIMQLVDSTDLRRPINNYIMQLMNFTRFHKNEKQHLSNIIHELCQLILIYSQPQEKLRN